MSKAFHVPSLFLPYFTLGNPCKSPKSPEHERGFLVLTDPWFLTSMRPGHQFETVGMFSTMSTGLWSELSVTETLELSKKEAIMGPGVAPCRGTTRQNRHSENGRRSPRIRRTPGMFVSRCIRNAACNLTNPDSVCSARI